ncbi:hypothetical protein J2X46_002047 [Nocardioides sp. BE266]|uniref:DUF6049 family protein n=1 Tax=Nocardioides sp. BE266 TaxID=2817725 RepID=UPI00286452A5|nr:DUF6049 family protein [Nocardioides sp. BE266]MDR7253062.1 hypothetical protein [Nocardioides sp. BE266]
MPRPSSFRAALAGLLTLGAAGAGALVPAAAAPAEDPDPLVVHIDSITPVLPRSGDVEITGTVTNVGDETFTRINLHAFSTQSPILDSANLATSALLEPDTYIGEQRIVEPDTFDTVDELAPGESAPFSDSVPVELLGIPDEPGVYWIGIQAIGDTPTVPRDAIADGRARTFIPARPDGDGVQETSVILPVRGRVWYASDGSIGGTARWARRLAEGGSLDAMLDMAESAGSTPYSWLVDPAVLHALMRLSGGNAGRSIGPDPNLPDQEPSATDTPSEGTATATPETLTPIQPSETESPDAIDPQLVSDAKNWLDRFSKLVGSQPVLTLPYGDLDVSAAVRNAPERLDQALSRSNDVMTVLKLPWQKAISPADGHLSPEALSRIPTDTLVLLEDTAFAIPPTSPDSVVRLLGHEVVVTSSGAEAGGPAPTAANDPLALRQRLLSEAALRLDSGDTAPLVVTLPTVWRGEDADQFFAELDQPWVDVVPFGEVAGRSAVDIPDESLAYTESDIEDELSPSSFAAATRATDAATILEDVLTLQTTIEAQVRDEVMVTLSDQPRGRPGAAIAAAGRTEDAIRADLAKIQIEAPTAVTLSSDNGPLGATLVNGLDQPVTVQVVATTDGKLTLTGDGVRELAPSARSVVRFEASTKQAGIHQVRLAVTTVDGVPLGSFDELPIRAARVSALIWIVMAAGALVLFGMIGYRLPRQIRARRAEQAAAERAAAEGAEAERAGVAAAPNRHDLEPGHP